MSIEDRIVCVDDTDLQVKWSGPWFKVQEDSVDLGGNGPPFLGTLHGISENGSMSLSFQGRSVAIWGNIKPHNTTTGIDPNWQCLIDGRDFEPPLQYPNTSYSNFPFCTAAGLGDSNHTIVLNAIVSTETLWVDQVQYQASAGVDLSNAWTKVLQGDGRVMYSTGWQEDDSGYTKWTYQTGATVTFNFAGESLVWGGYARYDPNASVGKASYAVDGSPPTQFALPGSEGIVNRLNQPYFTVTGLKPGPHRLVVTNLGKPSTAPLGLTLIYLKNAPLQQPRPSNRGKIIGGAVGGALGAIILALLVAFVAVKYVRQRRRSSGQPQGGVAPQDTGVAAETTRSVPSTRVSMNMSYVTNSQTSPSARPTSWLPEPQSSPRAPSISPINSGSTSLSQLVPQHGVPVYHEQALWINSRQSTHMQSMDGRPDPTDYDPYLIHRKS